MSEMKRHYLLMYTVQLPCLCIADLTQTLQRALMHQRQCFFLAFSVLKTFAHTCSIHNTLHLIYLSGAMLVFIISFIVHVLFSAVENRFSPGTEMSKEPTYYH